MLLMEAEILTEKNEKVYGHMRIIKEEVGETC